MHNILSKNKRLILTLPMLLASLFLASQAAPPSHAVLTGLVCIVFPSTATTCPTSSPTYGPVTVGTNITVGVRVQGSDPMGGFDIYVKNDPSILRARTAALGGLIVSPSLTSICINGSAAPPGGTGTCTVGTANGPGVVEVTTIEGSGLNECGGIGPCSGLAFTITYTVVSSAASTTLTYPSAAGCANTSIAGTTTCVLIADNIGTTLSESIQTPAATIIGPAPKMDPTSTATSCVPASLVVGTPTTCTATVTDTAATGATNPTGTVTFSTSGMGGFSPLNTCTLSNSGTNAGTCHVSYTPTAVGTGTHNIGASYGGDGSHSSSTAPVFALTVTKATPALTTVVSSTSIVLGGSVSDQASLTGGFPSTGVTGTVTYTLFPNSGCIAPGTAATTVTVGASNSVPSSGSSTPTATGSFSFNAVYNGDANNNNVTSACEPFTVASAPSFASGKIHWTHHLSLSKSGNMQTWTAIVANPLPSSVNVVVRIVGASLMTPSLSFDVTCGVTCVNTSGNVNAAAVAAGPVSVAAGTTFSFSFNQLLSTSFAGNKFAFTATLYWASGTVYSASNSKSGAFAVVS